MPGGRVVRVGAVVIAGEAVDVVREPLGATVSTSTVIVIACERAAPYAAGAKATNRKKPSILIRKDNEIMRGVFSFLYKRAYAD
jgi:hypothetical protein